MRTGTCQHGKALPATCHSLARHREREGEGGVRERGRKTEKTGIETGTERGEGEESRESGRE